MVVDLDPAAVQLDPRLLQSQALGEGRAAGGQEDHVGRRFGALAADSETDPKAVAILGDGLDLGLGVHLAAQLLEVAAVDVRDVGLDHGQDPRQHLEHGDLGAELAEERGELHPDHAAADHDQALGDAVQLQDRRRVDGVLDAVDGDPRRHRTGGQKDVLGVDLVLADRHPTLAEQLGGPLERLDAVGLEEGGDAVHQRRHHLRFPLLGGGEVEAQSPGLDAELGAPAGERVELRGGEQRLGRDAAVVEAGSAKLVLLDDDRPGAQLRRPDGCDITGGAAADHSDVVAGGHGYSNGGERTPKF